MFLLAKEYDNSLNAAKIINIIDAPIKILEDINDKERFLPYSFNPFQKPETDTACFDKSIISCGTLIFKYSFNKKTEPPAKTMKKNLTTSVVSISSLRTKAIIPIIDNTGENKAPVFKMGYIS
ncbi:hypothetical protein FIB82_25875 [Escherichia coli]|nr:hypothetical protein FIB37_26845 [Escherichia coli]TNT95209.1 hypothetical protein FIB82_25875 [Escherichia coli]